MEYPFHKSVICSVTVLFYGASPVEYRLDQNRVVGPKRYSTGESYLFSDLPLYLWLVFVYHEVHEDHEEFIIKLYRPLRFKPRGSPRGFLVTWFHFVPFVLFVVIFLFLASLEANNKTTDYRLLNVNRIALCAKHVYPRTDYR